MADGEIETREELIRVAHSIASRALDLVDAANDNNDAQIRRNVVHLVGHVAMLARFTIRKGEPAAGG